MLTLLFRRMNQSKKNKIASCLLAIFSLQIFLSLVFFVSIQYVKNSQSNFINTNFSNKTMFEKLALEESEYKKLKFKDGNEIVFNNVLYDIHSIKKEKGKYILLVLNDEKEKKLEDTGKLITDNNSKENVSAFSLLFTFLFNENPFLFSFHNYSKYFDFVINKIDILTCAYFKVPSPPPDLKA